MCRPGSDSREKNLDADAIFEGVLTGIEGIGGCDPRRSGCAARYKFRVIRAWRGVASPSTTLVGITSCDPYFNPAGKFRGIIYADMHKGFPRPDEFENELVASMCSRTVVGAGMRPEAELLGKPAYVPSNDD
jgi:hypothetical protein